MASKPPSLEGTRQYEVFDPPELSLILTDQGTCLFPLDIVGLYPGLRPIPTSCALLPPCVDRRLVLLEGVLDRGTVHFHSRLELLSELLAIPARCRNLLL